MKQIIKTLFSFFNALEATNKMMTVQMSAAMVKYISTSWTWRTRIMNCKLKLTKTKKHAFNSIKKIWYVLYICFILGSAPIFLYTFQPYSQYSLKVKNPLMTANTANNTQIAKK
eukprot:NODE_260_length_11481_cov_1.187928.p9 type:complete len:114 gc:universal NODE_260_length_11481_cov_1.187928:7655-7996(+)